MLENYPEGLSITPATLTRENSTFGALEWTMKGAVNNGAILSLQNTSTTNSFSGLTFRRNDGVERMAVSWGNASASTPWTNTGFIELSNFTGTPGNFQLVHSGDFGSGFQYFPRYTVIPNGAQTFWQWIPISSTQKELLTLVNTGVVIGYADTDTTNRKVLKLATGGYAAPGALGSDSNGDKLIFWRVDNLQFDAGIGINADEIWIKSISPGGAVLKVYTGTGVGVVQLEINSSRIILGVPIKLKSFTVATLPAGSEGDTAYVTDALTPIYLGALTGGGAIKTPVFHNGSAWVSY